MPRISSTTSTESDGPPCEAPPVQNISEAPAACRRLPAFAAAVAALATTRRRAPSMAFGWGEPGASAWATLPRSASTASQQLCVVQQERARSLRCSATFACGLKVQPQTGIRMSTRRHEAKQHEREPVPVAYQQIRPELLGSGGVRLDPCSDRGARSRVPLRMR
jgi:hypothetical protein